MLIVQKIVKRVLCMQGFSDVKYDIRSLILLLNLHLSRATLSTPGRMGAPEKYKKGTDICIRTYTTI